MNAAPENVIRRTHALCPQCLRCVPAEVQEHERRIWLVKRCGIHGESRAFLSDHPAYYRDLNRFYFGVMRRSYAQRDYILRLTERCNLECPICLAGANQDILADFTVADVRQLVRRLRGAKLDLMGCEPTLLPDLPEILRVIRQSGNISALHTNGIALADFAYVQRLQQAGLDEVHLQFDGFDDEVYRVLRNKPLLEIKRKAFANLERLGIPVDLVMTVLAGVNEKEILPVLQFGAEHANVKEVFFLGCRMLGRAVGRFEQAQLLPDQVIDLLAQATQGRISRERVRRFQKLYFTLLSIFGVRKCLYIQHYLLFRCRSGSFVALDELVNMGRLERICERFRVRREQEHWTATPLFFLESLPVVMNVKTLGLLRELLMLSLLMMLGFNLRKVRKRSILLGYITACDPLIYDTAVAENCGKGEISRDLGFQEAGALANVMREHRWRCG
jgi:hypothetical protein